MLWQVLVLLEQYSDWHMAELPHCVPIAALAVHWLGLEVGQ